MTSARAPMTQREVLTGDVIVSSDDGGAAERVLGAIADLHLEKNAWELDTLGYTVLLPTHVAAPALTGKMLECILDASTAKTGVRPDLLTGDTHRNLHSFLGSAQYNNEVLFSDPVFERAIMTPSVLALVTYLLGESCAMTAMNAVIKGPGEEPLRLHVDTPQPAPLPAYAQVCNATWIFSDYSAENGATLFVPGSHLWCRNPRGDEVTNFAAAKPVEAPAGSVIIWHGNTWHGALPRTAPGLRISMITYFARYYMKGPQRDAVLDRITPEMLERNPERFTLLMGRKQIGAVKEIFCKNNRFA